MGRRVFITVAEVSGDKHAAQLVRSLRQLDPTLIIEGHGGPEMRAAGAIVHRDTVSRAAMGWRGALRALEVYRLLRWTKHYFQSNRPDLLIGVDSPSMNFHFARAGRELGVPTLQYVAPQLWAWARWRMKKVRKWIDQVACILPFEEAYFRSHGVNATFVGHPLFDELPADRGPAENGHLHGKAPVIGLLPGSRKSEAQTNFPHMLAVADHIRAVFPGASFLVPTTSATHPVVTAAASHWGTESAAASSLETDGISTLPHEHVRRLDGATLRFASGGFDEMVPQCDLCLVVSGTATLHVAGFGVPMIVVYRTHPLIWHGAGRWLIKARTFALVNLLSNGTVDGTTRSADHIVPEIVPWYGSNAPIARLALEYLREPEKLRTQRRQLRQLIQSLDHPGASDNVARLAIQMIKTHKDETEG